MQKFFSFLFVFIFTNINVIAQKKYNQLHREEHREYQKNYYLENKDKLNQKNKLRYLLKCEKEIFGKECNGDCFNCIYSDCIL